MTTPPLHIDGTPVLPRLSDYVDRFAEQTPDALAVVCGCRRVDYAALKTRVDACAKALLAAGVDAGSRVAMRAPPCLEFWIVFLATVKAGAIWVGLNPRYSFREADYVIGDATPRLLIADTRSADAAELDLLAELDRTHDALDLVTIGKRAGQSCGFDEFLADGERVGVRALDDAARPVATTDPCLIVYTSGSTGQPKGAVLTHYGLAFGATMQTLHFKVEHPSIVVSFPINHVASVADTCATTLVRGGKIVFLERFDAEETIRATERERCTIVGGVPTMYQMQLAAPSFAEANLGSVEFMLWGGAAMPVELIRQLKALGPRLATAYGMTETATHVTYTDDDADIETLATTVGRPDPNCRFRIATPDGNPSAADNPGEIQLKADFLMTGYWNRPDATRDAFTEDGWFRTGDVGYFQADGNLRLAGRMSDMFKSGGYNIYPREIETVLEAHPEVAIAAVVAVPDPLYQEVGVAWVKPESGASLDEGQLIGWCRKQLANYKIPKAIRIVDELPLLPVGKVDKQALKARSREAPVTTPR